MTQKIKKFTTSKKKQSFVVEIDNVIIIISLFVARKSKSKEQR